MDDQCRGAPAHNKFRENEGNYDESGPPITRKWVQIWMKRDETTVGTPHPCGESDD